MVIGTSKISLNGVLDKCYVISKVLYAQNSDPGLAI